MKTGNIAIAVVAGLGLWWLLSRGKAGGSPNTKFKVGDTLVSNIDPEYIVKVIRIDPQYYITEVLTRPYDPYASILITWGDANFHLQGTPAPAPAPPSPVVPKFAVGDICEATISGVYYKERITAIDATYYYVTSVPNDWQSTEYHIVWFDANFTKVG